MNSSNHESSTPLLSPSESFPKLRFLTLFKVVLLSPLLSVRHLTILDDNSGGMNGGRDSKFGRDEQRVKTQRSTSVGGERSGGREDDDDRRGEDGVKIEGRRESGTC
mmetsp:Transcript_4695/g.8705  ORF Transcript_4695/g.8705 Transcript_4695/m.8705 type:complete len:107 (+) Transcript_4695:138-458(+)